MELTGDLTPMERGTILHRCFEILGYKEIPIDVVRKGAGYDLSEAEYDAVRRAVTDLNAWIAKRFLPEAVNREVPILALDSNVSVVSGVVDLLLETREGCGSLTTRQTLRTILRPHSHNIIRSCRLIGMLSKNQ